MKKIINYEFTVFFRDINFHAIIVEKQQIKHDIFDTLSDLQFSPYVQIPLIPVDVERSNGTPTGTYCLVKDMLDTLTRLHSKNLDNP